MLKNKLLFLVLFIFINSCTLYQTPRVVAIKVPQQFSMQIPASSRVDPHWWYKFNDVRLNWFIAEALKNNYDYRVALKNILIAQTYVSQNLSNLFPQIDLNFNANRGRSTRNSFNDNLINTDNLNIGNVHNQFQLFASVSYELDLWNQLGNLVNQARADVKVSEADRQVIRLTLIASVANAYFQREFAQQNIYNLLKQREVLIRLVKIRETLWRSGLNDAQNYYDAEESLRAVELQLKNTEKQKILNENLLHYLVGVFSDRIAIPSSNVLPLNLPPLKLVPYDLPANVLLNRPDIKRAYYQALSFGYLQKSTIAAFLPNLNLTGEKGYASNTLGHLLSADNKFWNIGLAMTQTIFDYANRYSQYKRADLQFNVNILNYQKTVLNALKEVEDALVSYKKDREGLLALSRRYADLFRKQQILIVQTDAGLIDHNELILARAAVLQVAYEFNNQKLLVLQDIIQLYKTLGWGIECCASF